MSTLASYYDLLLPELPGCTTAMLDFHLRETVREFCSRTSVWRADMAAINLVADQAAYSITTPTESEVVRVTALTMNGEALWIDSDKTDGSNAPQYQRNDPPFSMSADLTQIVLVEDEVPSASLVAGLEITAALKPTASAATLPDFLMSQYSEAIRHGALSRFMVMKKPWRDLQLATYYGGRWESALNFAAYQGQVGNTRQHLRVKQWG
jgi:hypothetical protein